MKVLVIFLSVLLSSFSYAATLTGERGVELLVVDGQKVKNSFFSNQGLVVSDGVHQVVVQYSRHFKNDRQIESKPYLFDLKVKGDTKITTKVPRDAIQAKRVIQQGLVWIVSNNEQTQRITDSIPLSGEGYLPYGNIEKLVAQYNQKHGLSTLVAAPVAVQSQQNKVQLDQPQTQVQAKTKTQQLITIYNAATKQERKAFRIWLLEQDLK